MQSRYIKRLRRAFSKEGFSLIELIVSLAILAVCLMMIAGLVTFSLQTMNSAVRKGQSSNGAASVMEGEEAAPEDNMEVATKAIEEDNIITFRDGAGNEVFTINGGKGTHKTVVDKDTGLTYDYYIPATEPATTN